MTVEPPDGGAFRGSHRGDAVKLLFVASEIFPLAKTGGLADVCGSLPPQLAQLGLDVRLLMPGYPEALDRLVAPRLADDFGEVLPGVSARLIAGWMPDTAIPIWLVECPALYQRPGSLYQDPEGRDWSDNALRFGLLCLAAARIGLGRTGLEWRPDIVHAHDWPAGLVPLRIACAGEERPRTVFTVHNAAFQGNFSFDAVAQLGLPGDAFTPAGAEFYGALSFLKAGVRYANRITTVSPTYARELRTAEFGFGLEGLFEARQADLHGIMNGIDRGLWDPANDPHLTRTYSADDLHGKRIDKATLQHKSGLYIDAGAPLAMFASRLTGQKMADAVLEELPAIMARHPRLQFALHGRGDAGLEQGFRDLVPCYPGRLAVRIGYEEAYAHQLHGGADILLHGSRFEPCGLTQLYAMRYGTLPIVRRVGGLADSVTDAAADDATGFVFDEPSGAAMAAGLSRAVAVYEQSPQQWAAMQRRAMAADFGWASSAAAYAGLYSELVPGLRSGTSSGVAGRGKRQEDIILPRFG